ncbi:MAG: hypothetical protein P8P84_20965 [Paracoccaceae bacterium]|nr:hypothetical protein [Paracoccaceae bacterium]
MLLREIEMKPGPKACIDTMSVEDAGHALIAVQEKAVRAVNSAMPQLRQAAKLAADTLCSGGGVNYVAAIQRVMQELHFDFFTRGKIPSKKSDHAKQEQQKVSGIRLGVIYGLLLRARR